MKETPKQTAATQRGEGIAGDEIARYRSLLDRMIDGVYVSTHEGRFIEVNQAMVTMLGYSSKEELLAVDIKKELYFEPSDRDLRYIESGPETVEVFRMRRRDGSEIWVEDHASYVHDEHGNILYHEGVLSDVTERVRKEERAKKIAALKEQLIHAAPIDKKMKRITDAVVSIFGADFARVWMVRDGDICSHGCRHGDGAPHNLACEQRNSCLHLVASSGRYTHIDGAHARVPMGKFMIGRVATGDEPYYVLNDLNNPLVQDPAWAKSLGLVSFAGFRLVSDAGEPIGVMAMFSKSPVSRADEEALLDLSNTVSYVIMAEAAVEAMRTSETRYRLLFENASEAIFLMEANTFIDCNSKTLDMYGCERSQILQQTPIRFSPPVQPDGRPSEVAAAEHLTRAFAGEAQQFEWQHIRYDGTPFDAEVRLNRVFISGKIYLQALVRDITARKQAEMKLRESHAELERALAEVKTLSGLIPICATCKKIRDDKGYWNQIESYMQAHTDAEFTHGICPDCMRKFMEALPPGAGKTPG